MGYRLRISDEIYRMLQEKAASAGVSIELLAERYISEAFRIDAKREDGQVSRPWQQTTDTELRLVAS